MSCDKEIHSFLLDKDLVFSENDHHYQIDCFLCTDTKKRLGIKKETGQFHCFNCNFRGNSLKTLKYGLEHKDGIKTRDDFEKKHKPEKCKIKDNFHVKWWNEMIKDKKKTVLNYLKEERGFNLETIKHFKFGSREGFKNKKDGITYNKGHHLAIPSIVDGKCVCVKYRNLNPNKEKTNKWRREDGGITALFNHDAIYDLDYKTLYIAESELDAASLWQLGIKNVVGLTAGAKTFKVDWIDLLERYETIYLVLDADEAGQEGARKLAGRLGMGRVKNVLLPDDIKDPNDFLKKYTLKDFQALIKKAKYFSPKGVISLGDTLKEIHYERFIKGETQETGIRSNYKRVDRILGPLKGGYLIYLTAKPKCGKTSYILDELKNWAKKGIQCGMYQVEMRPVRLGEKLVKSELPELEKIEHIEPEMLNEAAYRLPLDNLHFYYPQAGDMEIDKVCDKIREMVHRYGIEVFCFDNLLFLTRGENMNALIDEASQKFKLLAEELDIVLFVVTHPKKTNSDKQLKDDDMKGSSSAFQDADAVIKLNRESKDNNITGENDDDEVKSKRMDFSTTNRWHKDGKTWIAFHTDRSLFSERGKLFNELGAELAGKSGKKSRPKKNTF